MGEKIVGTIILGPYTTDTIGECLWNCVVSSCIYWTYFPATKTCYEMSNLFSYVSDPGAISAHWKCHP